MAAYRAPSRPARLPFPHPLSTRHGDLQAADAVYGRQRSFSPLLAARGSGLADPHLFEDPQNVAAENAANIGVRVVVLYEPPGDVGECFRRVLDPIHERDLLEVGPAARSAGLQLLREYMVQRDVVAERGVGTERDMLNPHQLEVLEVLHERFGGTGEVALS